MLVMLNSMAWPFQSEMENILCLVSKDICFLVLFNCKMSCDCVELVVFISKLFTKQISSLKSYSKTKI